MKRYKFKIGQRVSMTGEAIKQCLAPRGRQLPCLGIVTGIKPPLAVKVIRDGTKSANYYHIRFWKGIRSRNETHEEIR